MRSYPVESSSIRLIAYDPQSMDLRVQFDSSTYVYHGVPAAVVANLMFAASAGSYFAKVFKPMAFEYERLEAQEAAS